MTQIRMIPVDLIDPHPHNPRRDDAIVGAAAPLVIAYGLAEGWRIAEWLGLDTHYRSGADLLDLLAERYPEVQPAAVLLCGCSGLVLAEASA